MACSRDIKEQLGLVQVYTGDGKGKTTASLGLGFRAAGCGLNVLMLQFLKPAAGCGEQLAVGHFDNFTFLPLGLDHMNGHRVDRATDLKVAAETFAKAKELIYSGKYDLVILDEINVAMDWELLDPAAVISMLQGRPEHIEVVLTGRHAPAAVIDYADLVTEMKMIKHPFAKGVGARRGIEY
ncbi:MAG: cob(I)yrinic acid a,c-diamide adenosyltransferase [Candidatus Methanomethylophilus sp.]|jgi:cob(I)alamin adenosyltransferase|nr:cob(I)yrinic acid a,c-diamide adenosyltransferase [Methanomethylophilus sp.]MDD4221824.1 cob(I)yrinic acid a,c-diamide adenosyltransferase [Methanomethylophilus sp.]MDD4668498.1 cob(I)yrinic acid a,c-diamide adenosyltransferase [Methanomethylophilus sp.]